ncbi:MAG: hypothetical protein IPJ74_06995 [Saprospiraceae bacterium]|nr:hypothetical protein [Saprospiraceae bacterium]
MKDLIEKKLGDGELKNAISIFLKWEIINNETRSELLLSSSRYNSAYRNYLNGLMREEDFRIESNKITLATLELLHEIERRYIGSPLKTISPSILVAGTGTDSITENILFQNSWVII